MFLKINILQKYLFNSRVELTNVQDKSIVLLGVL